MTESIAMVELPKYRCHKEVWALKIKEIRPYYAGGSEPDGHELVFEDKRYAPSPATYEFWHRNKPEPGGYYVVYEDGYRSYSPAAAFESGYSRI